MATIKTRMQQKRDTTANWNTRTDFIPLAGEIIIYTDRYSETDAEGNTVYHPGIKIGDGSAYCIDLPFLDDQTAQDTISAHISDTTIHTNNTERSAWNEKVRAYMDSSDSETLVLTCF